MSLFATVEDTGAVITGSISCRCPASLISATGESIRQILREAFITVNPTAATEASSCVAENFRRKSGVICSKGYLLTVEKVFGAPAADPNKPGGFPGLLQIDSNGKIITLSYQGLDLREVRILRQAIHYLEWLPQR